MKEEDISSNLQKHKYANTQIWRKTGWFTIITERMKEAEVTEKKGNDVRRAR